MNPLVTTPKDKALLLAQLVLVPAIIAGLPGNLWKLLALLFVWALSFRRPSRQEWVMVAFACVFFTAMNAASLQQGIFSFTIRATDSSSSSKPTRFVPRNDAAPVTVTTRPRRARGSSRDSGDGGNDELRFGSTMRYAFYPR